MAVNPTSSMTPPHLLPSLTSRVADHVGPLLLGFLGTIASFLQVDRFIGTMPNLKIYHLSSVMVDIKLLCDLSAVVPGEVVTPPCLRGIRLNILVILAVNFILHASAVAVIDFRSTAGKIPFFSN